MCEEVPYQEDGESDLKYQEGRSKKSVFFAVFGFIIFVLEHILFG
jgi:hypothetical protein